MNEFIPWIVFLVGAVILHLFAGFSVAPIFAVIGGFIGWLLFIRGK